MTPTDAASLVLGPQIVVWGMYRFVSEFILSNDGVPRSRLMSPSPRTRGALLHHNPQARRLAPRRAFFPSPPENQGDGDARC